MTLAPTAQNGKVAPPSATAVGPDPRHTMAVAKQGKSDSDPSDGTAVARRAALEVNGFKGHPVMRHSFPNAPEASSTGRNVRLMRSSGGVQASFHPEAY